MLLVLCAVLCVCGVRASGVDELVEAMEGPQVRLCVGQGVGGAGCSAVVWRQRWVAARASCLAQLPRKDMRALAVLDPNPLTCDDLVPVPGALRVVSIIVHPSWTTEAEQLRGPYDLALAAVERPFDARDHLVNHTIHHQLEGFAIWMEKVFMGHYGSQEKHLNVSTNKHYLLSSPVLLFLTTMVLPAGLFMACFLFVTFCTGSPVKMPYTNVDGSELDIQLMCHEYTLRVPISSQE